MDPIAAKKQKSIKDGPSEKEWKETQSVLAFFLRAWNNYSLYPETHINCKTVLERFYAQLDLFLKTYGKLRFDFIKGHLIFKGKKIFSEPRKEGNLTYNLFRDGIQWLQFKKGLEEEELRVFLRILNEYRILAIEPDGDLVTALWSNPLPHIQYHVADFFWGAEPDITFSTISRSGGKSSSSQKDIRPTCEFESILPLDIHSLVLTHKEYEKLNVMVRLEETRDPTPDFLDALIDCLLQHKQEENFELVLDALEEEFYDSILRKEFDITQRILKSLRYVLGYAEAGTPWVRQKIDTVFVSICSLKSLQPIMDAWDDFDEKQLAKIKGFLLLFQPKAIGTLGSLFLQSSSFKIQQMIVDVILSLASRDYKPVEALLDRPEEKLVTKLVSVLSQIKGEGPLQLLFKSVHHSSAKVRQEAIYCLLRQKPENIQKLYSLINDENDVIRRTILSSMGREKRITAEDFLINYLGQEKFTSSQESHVIECYRTLGQCGSDRSLPFLTDAFMGRGSHKSFLNLTDRKGAAMALKRMGSKEADRILEDASRSLYPNIRFIARQAMKG